MAIEALLISPHANGWKTRQKTAEVEALAGTA
jgi:hypothetical protein